jgi:hypothetical protein
MKKPLAVAVLALSTVHACGGGGGNSPTAPQRSQPQPGISFSSSAPAPGATITVTGCSGVCTSDLVSRFTVTPVTTISAQLFVEYYNAGQLRCGFHFVPAQTLPAGQATTLVSDFLTLGTVGGSPFCPYPATTSRVHASVLTNGVNGPRVLESDFPISYTFVAPAAPVPAPTPAATPRPPNNNPAPTPAPTAAPNNPSGYPLCVGNPNNASCGRVTGGCNNGDWTCSQNRQGSCSQNGGLKCVVCPGPLCQ